MNEIPIVEQLPLMVTCDKVDARHHAFIKDCPVCEEDTRNKLNFELQVEADKLKRK